MHRHSSLGKPWTSWLLATLAAGWLLAATAPRLEAATVNLREPMGGEVYVSGATMTIEWDISLEPGEYVTYVALYYRMPPDGPRQLIGTVFEDVLDGRYTWSGVPAVTEMEYMRVEAHAVALDIGTLDTDTSMSLKIIPNSLYPSIYLARPQPDCSASSASCTTPLELEGGSVYIISWRTTGCLEPYASVPMTVSFSSNGGLTWGAIGTIPRPCDTPLMGWTVPDIETTRGKIRLDWGTLDTSTSVYTFAISEAPPPPNHPPVADAGPDQTVPEGARVDLDGTGSHDEDPGDTITYTWLQTDGLAQYVVDLHDASTSTPWFTAPTVSTSSVTLQFSLTVRDNHGAWNSDDVRVTIAPGSPHISSFTPREGWEKTPITLEGSNLSGCQVRMHGTRVATVPPTGYDDEFTFYLPGGLPLGATPITVTSAAGSYTTSGRFEVTRDPWQWDWGFGFRNPSVDDMSWADYDRAFGHSIYLWVLGIPICCDRCSRQCHDPIAQLLFDSFYRDLGEPGLCWGMCSQGLTYYYGDSPTPYVTPVRDWPFDLSPETEIARRIKRDHLRQVSAEIISYLLDHYDDRPLDVLAQIEAATTRSPPQPGIIGIVGLVGGGSLTSIAGHALVPDRVVQVSADEWRIYVYDPNREEMSECRDITTPSEYPRITNIEEYPFIRVARSGDFEEWSFEMRGGAVWGGNTTASIDISVSGETFLEIPYFGMTYYSHGVVRGPHHLPTSPEGIFTIIFGAADGGIENENQRVGHDRQGRLYLQIPDALPVVPMANTASETEAYILPDDDYRVRLYGRKQGTYEWMALHADSALGLSSVETSEQSEDAVDVTRGNRSMTLRTNGAEKSYSARIVRRVGADKDELWRVFEVLGTSIQQGDAAVFRTRDQERSLVYENRGSHGLRFAARLALTSLGPQPEPPDNEQPVPETAVQLEVPEIRLGANQALILTPSSWEDLGNATPRISIVPVDSLETAFIRGDANADGQADISDAITILGHLYLGNPVRLVCPKAADVDDTGDLVITDAIYLLGYRFLGGPSPPAPFPQCGTDPTPDELDCESFSICENAN